MEVFIKASIQSVLAMTLKEDERLNSVWLLLFYIGFAISFIQSFIPSFADSRIKGGAKISNGSNPTFMEMLFSLCIQRK